nr:MAG TPA: hypothetical protein [Caudoviricetes sp.]
MGITNTKHSRIFIEYPVLNNAIRQLKILDIDDVYFICSNTPELNTKPSLHQQARLSILLFD